MLESGVKEWILDPDLFEEEISSTQRARWEQYYIQQPFGRLPERIAWAHVQDISFNARVGALKKGQPGIKIDYWDWMFEGKPLAAQQGTQQQGTQHVQPRPLQIKKPGLQAMTKEKWVGVRKQAISFEKAR